MSTQAFYVAYDGPALESNQMAVRDLAPALLALSDLFDETNRILNGGRADVRLDVKGSFKSGCFGIDFVVSQGLVDSLMSYLPGGVSVEDATAIAGLLGFTCRDLCSGLLHVIKWIRGRKITKVEMKERKAVIFIDGDHLEVESVIIDLLRNTRIRQALESAITNPLEIEGIDSFGVVESAEDTSKMFVLTKNDAQSFKAPTVEDEQLSEREYETSLQLIGLSFQDKNKWRFSDGAATFFADIADPVFLQKINSHRAVFAKDDIIHAKILERQKLTKDGIKTERSLIKITGHRSAALQLGLPIVTPEE